MKNAFIFTFIFLFGLCSCKHDSINTFPTNPYIMLYIYGKVVDSEGDGISEIRIYGEGDVFVMNSADSRGDGTFYLSLTGKPNLPLTATLSFYGPVSENGGLPLRTMELTFTDEDFVEGDGKYGRLGSCSKHIGDVVLEDAAPE